MNYEETLIYIHNTPKFARTLGNDLLKKLLKKLGNPQKDLKFIHIAGTNGKGSAAVMLSQILINSGLKVGLYTSPYIERFNERIRINGEEIPDDILADIATRIRETIEKYDTPVSEFALDTAIAFEYFKSQKCDIVVLETGLGGRLDATNVIDKSIVSVIMSIGLDHTQYLGETIEEITAEKCGIIKKGGKVVIYPDLTDAAISVVEDFCKRNKAELIKADMPEILAGKSFKYNETKYKLSLDGDFQKYNAATVLCAAETLKRLGYKISDDAINDGLLTAFNPARMEKLPCGLLIDGAHNPPAVKALCNSLIKKKKPIRLVIAMMEDKDIDSCISAFAEINPMVIATQIDMPRCLSANALAEKFKEHNIDVTVEENPITAAKMVAEFTENGEVCCVCGSLYLAGEIRRNLKNYKKYYVYILRCEDNSLYTGITTDVQRRFNEHKNDMKKGAKYTASHTPISIEAVFEAENRSEASKLEAHIKTLTKAQKEELIKKSKM